MALYTADAFGNAFPVVIAGGTVISGGGSATVYFGNVGTVTWGGNPTVTALQSVVWTTTWGGNPTVSLGGGIATVNVGNAPTVSIGNAPTVTIGNGLTVGQSAIWTVTWGGTLTVSLGGGIATVNIGNTPTVVIRQFLATAVGTVGIVNATVTINPTGQNMVGLDLNWTWVGTVAAEGLISGGNWTTVPMVTLSGAVLTATGSNGQYFVNAAGLTAVRTRWLTYTSGTVGVALTAGYGNVQPPIQYVEPRSSSKSSYSFTYSQTVPSVINIQGLHGFILGSNTRITRVTRAALELYSGNSAPAIVQVFATRITSASGFANNTTGSATAWDTGDPGYGSLVAYKAGATAAISIPNGASTVIKTQQLQVAQVATTGILTSYYPSRVEWFFDQKGAIKTPVLRSNTDCFAIGFTTVVGTLVGAATTVWSIEIDFTEE